MNDQNDRRPAPDPDNEEFDFSRGRRGVFVDFHKQANGNFHEVTDAQDRARQAPKRKAVNA